MGAVAENGGQMQMLMALLDQSAKVPLRCFGRVDCLAGLLRKQSCYRLVLLRIRDTLTDLATEGVAEPVINQPYAETVFSQRQA